MLSKENNNNNNPIIFTAISQLASQMPTKKIYNKYTIICTATSQLMEVGCYPRRIIKIYTEQPAHEGDVSQMKPKENNDNIFHSNCSIALIGTNPNSE
jgi:hypothetical protein